MPETEIVKAKLWKDIHTLEALIPKLRNYLNVLVVLGLMVLTIVTFGFIFLI